MALIGNIIWFVLGGLWLGLEWIVCGIVCLCTIIGIPYGVACFRIAGFAFFPFGRTVVASENAGVCTFALNVVWVVFAGIWLWLSAVIAGILRVILLRAELGRVHKHRHHNLICAARLGGGDK